MDKSKSPLTHFDPLIARWFTERFGAPTAVQEQAWPSIAAGGHVLVSAPTGSGKTLAAFLWALDRLITGEWPSGRASVLYVSPLKALNNDVRKNLLAPLGELREYFEREGRPFPEISVHTRSGDTPGDERRRVLRRPPEILITTPESLNILLTSRSGRGLLTGLRSVILDEIHAVAGTKRGVHLITAVERLTLLSGEFQRTALSATVRPVEAIAEFVGGLRWDKADDSHAKRTVKIIRSKDERRYDLKVSFPPDARETMADGSWWPSLIASFKKIIAGNRSTLLFANSRRTVERVARLINEKEEQELAYAHHGSLSRELRLTVEEKLKAGELRAIVATGSLELGIDIGELEEVVLVQTPFSLTSAVQRIGRAGHSVGATSRGTIFPTHGRDFVDAAVAARCVVEAEIEEVRPPEAPLDVLAQVILSMAAAETWDMDELYTFITCSWPYRNLSRRGFDGVLEMLAGRYADTRVRELRPRLLIDRAENTVRAREGTDRVLYMSGGTIPDRGYFDLRDRDTRAKIGELDEEFVWERRVGESFAFGTRVWRVWKISHNEVEATPVESAPGIIPFWKAGEAYRDFYFSEKIGLFLEEAERSLDAPGFTERLMSEWPMDQTAAAELVAFLRLQREATGSPLPHRRHLLIEHFDDPANRADRKQVILHTLWGGRVNQPFALCLAAAWEKRYGRRLETFADNDCVVLMLPHGFAAADLFALARSDRPERLLRDILETTGLFGARFRENAGRALLLPSAGFNRRLPLWLNRLRAGKLLDAVMGHKDFPVLLETWREIMSDDFDLPALESLLDEIDGGVIRVSECTTADASPFAAGLVWKQVNYYMYEDDTPKGGKKSSLSEELIREVLSSPLRPRIPRGLVKRLEEKLQRTAPGYAPLPEELADWAGERLFLSPAEWERLLEAVGRDHQAPADTLIAAAAHRVVRLTLPGADGPVYCALETVPRYCRSFNVPPEDIRREPLIDEPALRKKIERSLVKLFATPGAEEENGDGAAGFLAQWLSFYGPVEDERVSGAPWPDRELVKALLGNLKDEGALVIDYLTEGAQAVEICDRENLERLLRMLRRERRPAFEPLGLDLLPLYLAAWQGLTSPGDGPEHLQNALEQLFGYTAPAAAWEEYIFPARLSPYRCSWLDGLFQKSDLVWTGRGKKKTSFCFDGERELFREKALDPAGALSVIPSRLGRFSFMECAGHAKLPTDELTDQLWDLSWKGLISNDSYEVVRRGAYHGFSPSHLQRDDPAGVRAAYHRWESTRPMAGNWYVTPAGDGERDPMEEQELSRERVRQLLRRYGILFRELLSQELPPLAWGGLFKTLRLMELSGEILSGVFFEGIPGIQFIAPEALRMLSEPLPRDAAYWMNAADPASLCGAKLEGLKGLLPARRDSTFLAFRGSEPVVIATRNAASLEISVPPDDPRLPEYLSFFKTFLNRDFNPRSTLRVETVNGGRAGESPYAGALTSLGFTKYYRDLVMHRPYR